MMTLLTVFNVMSRSGIQIEGVASLGSNIYLMVSMLPSRLLSYWFFTAAVLCIPGASGLYPSAVLRLDV